MYDILLLAFGAVYAAALTWLLVGLGRNKGLRQLAASREPPSVSVIVAARDEAAGIGLCLSALRAQVFAGTVEVIVVDDRSEDNTAAVVESMMVEWPTLKLVRAAGHPRFACPKKSALAQGIESSSGELLLFTDADCRPPPQWIASTAGAFREDVGLVAGFAYPQPGRGLRARLLALDNLTIAAMSAGSFAMGSPLACTGRNLAYRRRVYDEVGGFADIGHLIGGDDVYFTRLVRSKASQWQLEYNADPESAVVCHQGAATWSEVTQQKLRHAAKAGHYRGPALALGATVYVFHLLLLLSAAESAIHLHIGTTLVGVWGAKWLIDALLVWRFEGSRGHRRLLAVLPLLEFGYIPYVLLFVPLGYLGVFRWKGQSHFRDNRTQSVTTG